MFTGPATPSVSVPADPPQPGVAPPEPDFLHTPQFAHAAMPQRTGQRSLGGLVIGYGLAGLAAVTFVFIRMVVRALGLPAVTAPVILAILGVASVGWLGWWFVSWIRANRTLPPNFVRSDDRYRIRCVGTPEHLADLNRLGPIQDNPFEPEEFLGFLVLPPRPAMIVLWVAISLTVAALAFALPLGLPAGSLVFVFYGAFAAGGLAVVVLWPTRIRVVPGRVDIIRTLVFRPDHPERRTRTLRTSSLLVDLRKWQAFITGPSPQTSMHIWLWPIRSRLELAHALLMAAASSASPAPLPDDPVT